MHCLLRATGTSLLRKTKTIFKFEVSTVPTRGRVPLAELRSAKTHPPAAQGMMLASLPAFIFGPLVWKRTVRTVPERRELSRLTFLLLDVG